MPEAFDFSDLVRLPQEASVVPLTRILFPANDGPVPRGKGVPCTGGATDGNERAPQGEIGFSCEVLEPMPFPEWFARWEEWRLAKKA